MRQGSRIGAPGIGHSGPNMSATWEALVRTRSSARVPNMASLIRRGGRRKYALDPAPATSSGGDSSDGIPITVPTWRRSDDSQPLDVVPELPEHRADGSSLNR